MPTYQTLILEIEAGVATVTLNRPDRLNALTDAMLAELLDVIDLTDSSDEVRAVIVTGAGRAFCAGADLEAGAATFGKEPPGNVGEVRRDRGGRIAIRIFKSLKPMIAAINGAAAGVGATMLLPMDIRLASTAAKFGFVFARRGLVPEAASSWFFPKIVGLPTALEWCYTGRIVSAEEALSRGLVRSVHAPEELMGAARAVAREIADHSAPVSIALTRQLLWRNAGADHPMEAHKADSRAIQARSGAPDVREGVAAFLEKRPPNFSQKVSSDLPEIWPGAVDRNFD